jgi:hypothetical protein
MTDTPTEPAAPQPETAPLPEVTKKKPRRRWWRWAALAVIVAGAVAIGRPALHLWRTSWRDVDELETLPEGVIDDASRMNRTEVREIWPIPADPGEAERELAALLQRAAKEGAAVSIAGARHSMGGHTFTPDGLVIDMLPFNAMELDDDRDILRVGAGATARSR